MTSFAARIPLLVRVRRNAARERSRMFRAFVASLRRPVRILDLGGTAEMWSRWQVTAADAFAITLLNHHRHDPTQRQATVTQPFIHDRRGDALQLSASDLAAFDVVFSNSMLEHLPSPADQAALARFIAATGLPYFIQVPNKFSPVDPHFPHPLVPFFALYPKPWQARLLTWSALGSGGRAGSIEWARQQFAAYHPLGRRDLRRLFPQASLRTQWTFGLPMSIIAQWQPD